MERVLSDLRRVVCWVSHSFAEISLCQKNPDVRTIPRLFGQAKYKNLKAMETAFALNWNHRPKK
jgi:hypothetical protein